MTSSDSQAGSFLAGVVEQRDLCREHFEVILCVTDFPQARPGQFVQIRCGGAPNNGVPCAAERHSASDERVTYRPGPMLRRPFSIAGITRHGDDSHLSIVGRVVGPGTAWLSALRAGQDVGILGPLGRGFTLPQKGETALLIAGGVGLPPIRWLAEALAAKGVEASAIIGAQTRELLAVHLDSEPCSQGEMTACVREFARHGIPTTVTTDDGSCGLAGRVTDAMRRFESGASSGAPDFVFACGPDAMLRGVGRWCLDRAIPCELALERVMGCGMGTCQSCVVTIHDATASDGWRYALCCREGPVFAANRLKW